MARKKRSKKRQAAKKTAKAVRPLLEELSELPMIQVRPRTTWYEKLCETFPILAAEILQISDMYITKDPKVCVRFGTITALHKWLAGRCMTQGYEMPDRQAFVKFIRWREGHEAAKRDGAK